MAERKYFDRINEVRNDKKFSLNPPLPVNDLRLELSNYCNHQCIFCAHRKMTRPKRQMDEGFLYRILNEAYEAGFRGLGYYASGEPFMTKKLADYVRLAKDIGYEYVYIDSNGGAVEFDRIKEVIDAGLDSIKFSINGTDRETYRLIHGRDDFDKVIKNLKQTYSYKKQLNRNLNVFISFAVTKYTENSLDAFLEEYNQYADDIITADVIDMGGYVPEVREYLRTTRQTDFMKGMTVPCYTLWNTFIVTCEGYVTACCADFQNYFVFADLNKESIKDAWHNETITELRKQHLEGKAKGTPCESCVTGRQIEWRPARSEYAVKFDREKMFDMSEARRRIDEYEDRIKGRKSTMGEFGDMLDFHVEVKDYAKEVVERLRSDKKDFVQFGAGITGTNVVHYFRSKGLEPLCFCDNNPLKEGSKLEGMDVYSFEGIKSKYGTDIDFVISCDAFMEIGNQLVMEGG